MMLFVSTGKDGEVDGFIDEQNRW